MSGLAEEEAAELSAVAEHVTCHFLAAFDIPKSDCLTCARERDHDARVQVALHVQNGRLVALKTLDNALAADVEDLEDASLG